MRSMWAILAFLLAACSASPARDAPMSARDLALATIKPYLKDPLTIRKLSSSQPSGDNVAVELADGSRSELPSPGALFTATRKLNDQELTALTQFVVDHHQDLGAGGTANYAFVIKNQFLSENRIYVRFHQMLERRLGARTYRVKIQGADLIAILDGGKLRQLRSHFVTTPDLEQAFLHPGIDMAFTDHELATFVGLLKISPRAYATMTKYFGDLASRAGTTLQLEPFLNRQLSEQRDKLQGFWSILGTADIARLLIDAAMADQLSLAQYNGRWVLQLSSVFNLPMEFDFDFSSRSTNLVAKNLRLLSHELVAVHSFEAPHFPGGVKQPGTDEANHVTQRMQEVLDYFQRIHGWNGYQGGDTSDDVNIYTQLNSASFKENAAWLGSRKQFVVGSGGTSLFHLDDSVSVLGHEFTHAIVQFSSGLVYRGESGAINEHFADLQGASMEATNHRAGLYDFTVGSDVLTPAVHDQKEKMLELIFSTYHYQPAEKASFFLDRVALRHLYAPQLSFATQYDTVADAAAVYTADCEPSAENDNCGVHTVSGVPNKAASLIISVLGLEETKKMFFRTVVHRLSQNSTFAEYAQQLFEECQLDLPDPTKCNVVLASFAAVGVQVAGAPPIQPPTRSLSPQTPIPTLAATTPELTFCGWVKRIGNDNLQIFDDKFNAVIAVRSASLETKGDARLLSHLDCACVTGRITSATDELNKTFNAFYHVSKVKDRGGFCAASKELGPKKPVGPPPSSEFERTDHTLCGWVKVKTKLGDVVIEDNKFDVSLLKTPNPARTAGDFSALSNMQCACVTGRLAHTKSAKGFLFNYLPKLNAGGVKERDYKDCIGIEWR